MGGINSNFEKNNLQKFVKNVLGWSWVYNIVDGLILSTIILLSCFIVYIIKCSMQLFFFCTVKNGYAGHVFDFEKGALRLS